MKDNANDHPPELNWPRTRRARPHFNRNRSRCSQRPDSW